MEEIIKINYDAEQPTVSARELHRTLEIKERFSVWADRRRNDKIKGGNMEEIIKSYKGFNKDMTCKNKQYEVGKDYEEDKALACECGMHACEYPLDCFKYYPPSKSVYCEVEQSGDISRHDDSKIASTKMRIGAQLNIAGIVNAAIKYTKEKAEKTCIEYKAATAGNSGAATDGN